MCSGSPGASDCATRCSQLACPDWPNHVDAVAGNMIRLEAKIGGITPDMLSFSGRNEVWFMYALRPLGGARSSP